MVLMQDDAKRVKKWRIGRIIKLHFGADQRVRVSTVKTLKG